MNEFELIRRYFSQPVPTGFLGAGDDCALLPVQADKQLAVSTDLLVEGRHFLADTDPAALGHKALAVNVSDLAAMGAKPLGCVLGLSLPHVDEAWLAAFSEGFYAYAASSHCPLVGGDTTRSDQGVVISVTVFGQVDSGRALQRNGARVGDDVWVTGLLGAPHVALQMLLGKLPMQAELFDATRAALERPQPPWEFAQHLPGLAHAALDISDGLLQDLGHILRAGGCGALLTYHDLPIHPAIQKLDSATTREAVLGGGDVYQLCFTAPTTNRERISKLAASFGVKASVVGAITTQQQLTVVDAAGTPISTALQGFDHFA